MKEPEFKPWLVKEIASERKPSCEMFVLPGYLSENVIYWWMQRLLKMDANKACVFGQTLPFSPDWKKLQFCIKICRLQVLSIQTNRKFCHLVKT